MRFAHAILGTLAAIVGGMTAQPVRIITPPTSHHPPSDAVILLGGDDLGGWTTRDGKPAGWTIADGVATVKPGTGDIVSKHQFSDAQIHVEFMSPVPVVGEGQGRGNSGVYIQGRYEIQVLDSYENETYPNGQCGAIYGQHPPLVNASRPPGQWQTYDIVFRAARFDDAGKRTSPATLTVFHNGILIHDRAELKGVTGGSLLPESAAPGPLLLQDHGDLVKYRNVWIRPLG